MRDWWECWRPGSSDLDYEPVKVFDVQARLLLEDMGADQPAGWLEIVNPSWRAPVPRPRGRHRRCHCHC